MGVATGEWGGQGSKFWEDVPPPEIVIFKEKILIFANIFRFSNIATYSVFKTNSHVFGLKTSRNLKKRHISHIRYVWGQSMSLTSDDL